MKYMRFHGEQNWSNSGKYIDGWCNRYSTQVTSVLCVSSERSKEKHTKLDGWELRVEGPANTVMGVLYA